MRSRTFDPSRASTSAGFDCVEVSPPFDPAGVTAFVAANACFEMLSLLALRR